MQPERRHPDYTAWVICPAVILLSYLPVYNLVARGLFMLCVAWFCFNVLFLRKPLLLSPPLTLFVVWTLFTLIPSIFAQDIGMALGRWVSVFLMSLVALSVFHFVVWHSSYRSWYWAYLVCSVISYLLSYPIFNQLLSIPYEGIVLGRVVGTLANANTFGRSMVQALFISLVLANLRLTKTDRWWNQILLLMVIFAVLQSGSRTALIGLILCGLTLVYAHGIRRTFAGGTMIKIFVIGGIVAAAAFVYTDLGENIVARFEILLSYVGLKEEIVTKEQSLEKRYALIETAVRTWLNRPFGLGLENFHTITGTYAHSNFFELLATVGLFGVVLYYAIYALSAMKCKALSAGDVLGSDHRICLRILLGFIATMVALDVSSVSYYSKTLWTAMAVVLGHMTCLTREAIQMARVPS